MSDVTVSDEQIGAYWDTHLAYTWRGIPDDAIPGLRARYIADVKANPEALRQLAEIMEPTILPPGTAKCPPLRRGDRPAPALGRLSAVRGRRRVGAVMTGRPVDVDPYADVRPPDGQCCCGGCIGMGPCDDDLGQRDDDDDGWFLDHDDWNEDEEYHR